MSISTRIRPFVRATFLAGSAFCPVAIFCACLGGASTEPIADDAAAGASLQQENEDIPSGCSLRWNGVKGDSVLYCPDLRPPGPPPAGR